MMPHWVKGIAAGALVAASPLGAQEVEDAVTEEAASATEAIQEEAEGTEAGEDTMDAPASAPAMFPTYVLFAPDRFLSTYGSESGLDAELEICLEEGESLRLARPAAQIASMELRGPVCTRVWQAAEVATILVEEERQRSRVRAGFARGTLSGGTASATRSPGFKVASGSADVLEQFPRGTTVTRRTEICLERGQQVTMISNRGQRVTYRGPGCARRNARPTRDNIGGFTFGWNALGSRLEAVALP